MPSHPKPHNKSCEKKKRSCLHQNLETPSLQQTSFTLHQESSITWKTTIAQVPMHWFIIAPLQRHLLGQWRPNLVSLLATLPAASQRVPPLGGSRKAPRSRLRLATDQPQQMLGPSPNSSRKHSP